MDSILAQERVRAYWNDKPCDSELSDRERLSKGYFLDIERQRYEIQAHIPEILSKIDWRGKQVLEIGTGVGTGARNIIGRGRAQQGIQADRGTAGATGRSCARLPLPRARRETRAH